MADDSKKSVDDVLKDSRKVPERPLDPSRDAEDLFGDTTGRTGMTTGTPDQISAEPTDTDKDDSFLPGGEIEDPVRTNPTGFTRDELSDAVYDKQAFQGMSPKKAEDNNDLASEDETSATEVVSGSLDDPNKGDGPEPPITDDVPDQQPDNAGEDDAVGGTTPVPESDDDVGDMMRRATGVDPDPDMDNPQEVDSALADKIDKDEDAIREE